MRSSNLVRSFRHAFEGFWFLLRTQRNARIEFCIGALVCGMGAWLRLGRMEWAVLSLTIALVLILEGVNTAIEAVVDLAWPNPHPLAKAAKDLSAATVLIAAIASAAVGILILGPQILQRLGR
jgi:diacylglycerol kinase (ATP)